MIKCKEISPERLEWLATQPIEYRIEMLHHHGELCRILLNDILGEYQKQYCGERHSQDRPDSNRFSRWGYNPGSVRIGQERYPVKIPRIRDNESGTAFNIPEYGELPSKIQADEKVLNSMIHGLSTRNYEQVLSELVDGFGLSSSSVSRAFIEQSQAKLEAFQNRRLDDEPFVALFLDGKHLDTEQIIIALGVTESGRKVPLDFIQATTENALAISELLGRLVDRGFHYDEALFVAIDGSKGLYSAVKKVFGKDAIIQRCTWHKRENVVSYLSKSMRKKWRARLQKTYALDSYRNAKAELLSMVKELESINLSAAKSLLEGMEETLTLHRLGVHYLFSKSFATTNCIESLNSYIGTTINRVKRWTNSPQRHRWIAVGLIQVEKRMRKVDSYEKLPLLVLAMKRELANQKK